MSLFSRGLSIALAFGMVGLATTAEARDRRADDEYRRSKLAVKDRCRAIKRSAPRIMGPGNGRMTFTAPARPSAREACVRDGMREARARRDAHMAHDSRREAHSTN